MNRKIAWLVTPLLLACVHIAEAQPVKRVLTVGVPVQASVSLAALHEAFLHGLRELGYVVGRIVHCEMT